MQHESVWTFCGDSSVAVAYHLGVVKNLLRAIDLNEVTEMHFEGANIILALPILTNWMKWLDLYHAENFDVIAELLLTDPVAYFLGRPRLEWPDALELLSFHEHKGIALPECIRMWLYPVIAGKKDTRERWDFLDLIRTGLSMRSIVSGILQGDTREFHERETCDTIAAFYPRAICNDLLRTHTRCTWWVSYSGNLDALYLLLDLADDHPRNSDGVPWIIGVTMFNRMEPDTGHSDRFVLETYAQANDKQPLSASLIHMAYEWGCENTQERADVILRNKRIQEMKSPRSMVETHDADAFETRVQPPPPPSKPKPAQPVKQAETYSICDMIFNRKKKPAPIEAPKPAFFNEAYVTTPIPITPKANKLQHYATYEKKHTLPPVKAPRKRVAPTPAQIEAIRDDPDFIFLLQTENSYYDQESL